MSDDARNDAIELLGPVWDNWWDAGGFKEEATCAFVDALLARPDVLAALAAPNDEPRRYEQVGWYDSGRVSFHALTEPDCDDWMEPVFVRAASGGGWVTVRQDDLAHVLEWPDVRRLIGLDAYARLRAALPSVPESDD